MSSASVSRHLDAAALPLICAACEYGEVLGVPALFGRALFGSLAALEGDEGARRIIRGHHGATTRIPFPLGILDIDTPRNVQALHRSHISAS